MFQIFQRENAEKVSCKRKPDSIIIGDKPKVKKGLDLKNDRDDNVHIKAHKTQSMPDENTSIVNSTKASMSKNCRRNSEDKLRKRNLDSPAQSKQKSTGYKMNIGLSQNHKLMENPSKTEYSQETTEKIYCMCTR